MQMESSSEQEVAAAEPEVVITTTDAALSGFYADRALMWRNVRWITFGHFGMAFSMTIVEPLMNLRLRAVGVSDSSIGLLTSANLWAVSFLVMYFSWKSDHCTSKLGRRTPFVLLSLPFIAIALVAFPLLSQRALLVGVMLAYYFFSDMRASTYPLLAIDCVSKEVLARVNGIVTVMLGVAGFLSARLGSKMADVNPTPVFLIGAAVMAIATLLALWKIKEPPIYHPAEGKFNLLAPVKVALSDKRVLVLMVAVALLHAFPMIFKTWVWFYSRSRLGLSIGETGAAMSWGLLVQIVCSYPAGWLIDRAGSYRALCLGWLLMLALVVCSLRVTNAHGLVVLVSLYFLFLPLQVAGDAILWKTIDKADIGSYTSTVALVRNFATGTVIAISGFLIRWTGSYLVAFWFGFGLSTIALLVFFAYRHLMRSGSTPFAMETGTVAKAL